MCFLACWYLEQEQDIGEVNLIIGILLLCASLWEEKQAAKSSEILHLEQKKN